MKVFISWSGDQSRMVAEALHGWLPRVVQSVRPWLSAASIDPGQRWSPELSAALQASSVGIFCLTPQNLDAPWLLFEAGAVSKIADRSRVIPYLLQWGPEQLTPPLSLFQGVSANSEGTYRILRTLNTLGEESHLTEQILRESFDLWWPRLESELESAKNIAPAEAAQPPRDQDDILAELLQIARSQGRMRGGGEEPAFAMAVPQRLGSRIRMFRNLRGLTQATLAVKLNVPQGYVSNMEKGGMVVDPEQLDAIGAALDVSPELLRTADAHVQVVRTPKGA